MLEREMVATEMSKRVEEEEDIWQCNDNMPCHVDDDNK